MRKREAASPGEKLLARVLEECLDEDLSFVPPEREIARTHTFPKAFEKRLEGYMDVQDRGSHRKPARRYGAWAACVLLFCVCGTLFLTLLKPKEDEGAEDMDMASGSFSQEAAKEGAMNEAQTAEEAPKEEASTEDEALEDADGALAAKQSGNMGREYCGQTVEPSSWPEVLEPVEGVAVLVNCPVQAEEDPVIYLTVGNTGERTVHYKKKHALEVWLEDGWYVIPPKDGEESMPSHEEELEAGMAVDEEIDLSGYQMDHSAERYRVVVQVDDEPVCAEFTFEGGFSQQMERLEEEGSSRE